MPVRDSVEPQDLVWREQELYREQVYWPVPPPLQIKAPTIIECLRQFVLASQWLFLSVSLAVQTDPKTVFPTVLAPFLCYDTSDGSLFLI